MISSVSTHKLKIIDHLDTPERLDCSFSNIPGSGSSPIQVVAALYSGCSRIRVRDGVGSEFYGLYAGPSGQEVLQLVLGGLGVSEVDHDIPAGTRISLRSMSTSAISRGIIAMEFLTHGGNR